ncbi:MAG: nucleotidyltransferase domain-containing protein [Paludibacter sp.]|nr:nucleotidyltransferase domain-containing protein [Paludibacter sp.]
MLSDKNILLKIKELVSLSEPTATVILFGSHARGENNKYSDFDILILVDSDKITYSDEKRIKDPLYDLEFETGKVISPVIISRNDWEKRHSITPFYKNIKAEGISL